MNLLATQEHENIGYPSLWKREVRRDFCSEDTITKSPLSPLCQRGVFLDNDSGNFIKDLGNTDT
jgi:hypothetical protein